MAADITRPDFTNLEGNVVQIFDLLIGYLDNDSDSSAATAQTITNWARPFMDSLEDMYNIAFFWGALFWIIKQLPPEDSRQDSLVKLLLKIQEQPPPPGQGRVAYEEITSSSQFWKDLPHWRGTWTTYELEAPFVPPMRDRRPDNVYRRKLLLESWCPPLSQREWTSLNAFLARIHTASPGIRYVDLKGMWMILEALERDHTPSTLDDLVPGAACWILYAGRELKNNAMEYPQYDSDNSKKRLPWSLGELYNGPKGFSDERWRFWKGRFNSMSVREDLREETRAYAEPAWLEMRLIELLDGVTPHENATTSSGEPSEGPQAKTGTFPDTGRALFATSAGLEKDLGQGDELEATWYLRHGMGEVLSKHEYPTTQPSTLAQNRNRGRIWRREPRWEILHSWKRSKKRRQNWPDSAVVFIRVP